MEPFKGLLCKTIRVKKISSKSPSMTFCQSLKDVTLDTK
jgi:hypothetical protein